MSVPPETTATRWHAIPGAQALTELDSRPEGLGDEEIARRLQRYGPNHLPQPRRRSAFMRLLLQFHNILIYVLLLAAVVTALLGHWVDTAVIIGVVVINALIGFLQEGKAEKALDAIRSMLSQKAMVLRDGHRREIPAEELVPGDIVLLQSGDKVPADLRLIKVRNLQIEEAALTGESVPVEKAVEPVAADAELGDRTSMAYSSTLVTYGQGTGVVVATGGHTEIGRISAMLTEVETLTTPLLRQVDRFGRLLSLWIAAIAAATFAVGVVIYSQSAEQVFMAAVGLAVAAIPEGLPAIITITLAIGVQRMAARNAIIRRLPAVETLGSVSVICSDKTGTLTRNEMTVKNVVTQHRTYDVSGVGYDPHGSFSRGDEEVTPEQRPTLYEICRAAVLCNDATLKEENGHYHLQGDPTEGALLTLGLKACLDPATLQKEFPRTDAIPFESEHRFMATLHHDHAGNGFILLKGAPERVLTACNSQRMDGDAQPLDVAYWHERIDELAARGQRILAIATKPTDNDGRRELTFAEVEGGLTLLGLVGLIDPPREEAIRAVAKCRAAGIRVKMITGDHAVTARAIGAQMGIGDGTRALTGKEIEQLDEAALRRAVLDTDVFARASPEHKLRLVEALQAEGKIIAMTGDGVNDAPALKRADVGVAMGVTGTEAAKEAAEMVLTDDNFASIAHAVEEGRTVYDNIRKSIMFILPTNGGQAFTIVAAILLGRSLPISPLQILWVNMVTAVTLALALAFEPPEPNVMRRPPRKAAEPLLSRFLAWRILFVSTILVAGTFGLFLWHRTHGTPLEEARTIAVNTLVMFEVFYIFSSRYILEPSLSRDALFGNRYVLIAVALVLTLQLLFTYAPPMQHLFHTVPLRADTWLQIVLIAATVFPLVELEKWAMRRWQR
ncbi:cation-transporting P-type ATPase [Sulfurivermis fontis]|uniref:cation-transporting P-type ATPase n=1 Tax=Sulfurivermis fontis TaxID=1972068 RepID=UPI000FDAD861|nr:cation-transporting P-type ATPase [Sulfurivermis fontis]